MYQHRYVEKFKEGKLDRVRGRTLLGGNRMESDYADKWDEISSRTISLTSLNVIIALMAYLKMDTGTMDHKSAFLLVDLPEEDQVYAKLPKAESNMLLEIDETIWKPFMDKDGHIYI